MVKTVSKPLELGHRVAGVVDVVAVIAVAAVHGVRATAAFEDVVAAAAGERVIAGAAGDRVVAVAAGDGVGQAVAAQGQACFQSANRFSTCRLSVKDKVVCTVSVPSFASSVTVSSLRST